MGICINGGALFGHLWAFLLLLVGVFSLVGYWKWMLGEVRGAWLTFCLRGIGMD